MALKFSNIENFGGCKTTQICKEVSPKNFGQKMFQNREDWVGANPENNE